MARATMAKVNYARHVHRRPVQGKAASASAQMHTCMYMRLLLREAPPDSRGRFGAILLRSCANPWQDVLAPRQASPTAQSRDCCPIPGTDLTRSYACAKHTILSAALHYVVPSEGPLHPHPQQHCRSQLNRTWLQGIAHVTYKGLAGQHASQVEGQ